MKIKIFLSSRFDEFKDLRKYIIKNGFKEIGLDIEIVALDKESLANFLSPKEASIEGVEISNIYMLFLGKTYGTTPKDDVVSFTHREYREARRLGLPVLVFLTDDEKREEKVEEFIKEIEENEIYGIISGDIEKDYELVLNSLKEVILKLAHYGIKYVTKLNQVDFGLLEKKSKEFISDLGGKYIGNIYLVNIENELSKVFNFIEEVYFYKYLNYFEYVLLENIYDILEKIKNENNITKKLEDFIKRFNTEFEILKKNIFEYKKAKINDELLFELYDIIGEIKNQNILYKIEKLVENLIITFHVFKISINRYINIFLKKQLLLKGEALVGKTHLFCEVAKERLKNKKPTILFFGHQFKEDKSIVRNMIDLLDIDIRKDETFLESLNNIGKKYNSRVLIMIDAMNETKGNLWKNEIISFSNKIKNYEYLALALSIRDVEEYKLIDSSNENFIKENFEIIEHKGITLTLKDIEKICKYLEIEIINIPTHMFNLFVNPGIMWIYLENIKKTSKKVNIKDVISPLDLFESIFNSLSERFNNRYSVNDKDELLSALEDIIEFGLKDNFYFEIEKRKLKRKLKKENYDSNILDFLISEGILREENEKIYFRYQKFENYFVMKYLLETREEKEILEKLIETNNEALLEAFVLLLPLKGIEIFDLNENLLQDEKIVKYFINSLIWRNKELIKETTKKYLNIFFNEFYKDEIFEMILHSSLIPNHPFNAEFLHTILKDLSIVKRDYIWSLFIHNSFENEKNVKKIIEWVLDLEDEKLIFEKKIATFYGITLSWFFTSSNRRLRDLATKALVKIFVNNLKIIPDILEKFREVNDLYVLERILAAIYVAVLIVEENENFYYIAKKIFEIVFKDKVIEHIMIRDYAYLTIDFISKKVKFDFDISKIYPPYGSKLPDYFPEFKKFKEKYKNGYIRQIIMSMRTEDMGVMYGDFGRYTFQFAIKNFNQNILFKNWSAKAIEFIISEIIKNEIDIFERAEKNLDTYSTDRYEHRVERIGKKYQWIAMYKILAIIPDNFKIRSYWDSYEDYKGSWQIGIRNIDPTLFLPNKIYKPVIKVDFFNIDDEKKWIESLENLDLKSKILFDDKIILHTYISKEKKDYKTRDVFMHFDSFIVKKQDMNKFIEWLENNNFWGKGPLPEATQGMTQIFIKEYPFSNVADYYKQDWCDMNGQLPCKILITYTRYLREFGNYDYSIDESQLVVLPNEFLIKSLNLIQTNSGVWSRDNKKIIYDLNLFLDTDFNEGLVMDKDSLFEFIKNSEYTIIWIMWAEKRIYSYKNSMIDMKTYKNSEFIGYGYFNDDFKFFEKIRRVR